MASTKKLKAAPSREPKATKNKAQEPAPTVQTEVKNKAPKAAKPEKKPAVKPKQEKVEKQEKKEKVTKARISTPKKAKPVQEQPKQAIQNHVESTLFEETPQTQVHVQQQTTKSKPAPKQQQKQKQSSPPPAPPSETPVYKSGDGDEQKKQTVSFDKIIANSALLQAVQDRGYESPSEMLQRVLPAALRGSDVLVYKPEAREGFLIGVVAAASRLLNEQIAKGNPHSPSVLFLAPNQEKLEHTFADAQALFKQLDITFGILKDAGSEADTKSVLDARLDVLFATPKSLAQAKQAHDLSLNAVGLLFLQSMDKLDHESLSSLHPILKALPLERVQKIFVSNANSGKIREFAFEYLEDPEYFSLLPSYVKERFPKQFAHALPATQKFQVLLGHLKHHKPQCAVVFANTNTVAEWIAFKLHGNGIKVDLVTSLPYAQKRQSLVKSVKSRQTNVIVTTDTHCRGFGLEDLNCIYHFDIPDSASKFMDRLNRIEGSRNPISILFICEDYGFNMNRIEEALGFKIHIVEPDKNYFSLKDTSEYPLEPSGRVKKIGQVYETPKKDTAAIPHAAVAQMSSSEDKFAATTPESRLSVPAAAASATTQPPLAAAVATTTSSASATSHHAPQQQQPRLHPRAAMPGARPAQDKFGPRDFKAREAIDAARQASQAALEKKKDTPAAQPAPQQVSLLSFVVSLAGDAVKAAVEAASQSISKNLAEKQPSLFGIFKKKK